MFEEWQTVPPAGEKRMCRGVRPEKPGEGEVVRVREIGGLGFLTLGAKVRNLNFCERQRGAIEGFRLLSGSDCLARFFFSHILQSQISLITSVINYDV